jgi:hypothetical protein
MHLAFTSQSHGFYLAGTSHVPGFGRLCPAFLLSVFYFLLLALGFVEGVNADGGRPFVDDRLQTFDLT